MIDNSYEIKHRIVFVMRLLEIGIERLNFFCGLMDMTRTFYANTFAGCSENVFKAAEVVHKSCVKTAYKNKNVIYT